MSDTVYRIVVGKVASDSRIKDYRGWPDDVREVVLTLNRKGRLRFVRTGWLRLCGGSCGRLVDSSGSTLATLDGVAYCDDCLIRLVERWGERGAPEPEVEKAKRWQRSAQIKLDRMRYNAASERVYVAGLKAVLAEIAASVDLPEHLVAMVGDALAGRLAGPDGSTPEGRG